MNWTWIEFCLLSWVITLSERLFLDFGWNQIRYFLYEHNDERSVWWWRRSIIDPFQEREADLVHHMCHSALLRRGSEHEQHATLQLYAAYISGSEQFLRTWQIATKSACLLLVNNFTRTSRSCVRSCTSILAVVTFCIVSRRRTKWELIEYERTGDKRATNEMSLVIHWLCDSVLFTIAFSTMSIRRVSSASPMT